MLTSSLAGDIVRCHLKRRPEASVGGAIELRKVRRSRMPTSRQERFTALLHHLNIELLRDSFYALKRQASPGVDGVRWEEYEYGPEDRLVDLRSFKILWNWFSFKLFSGRYSFPVFSNREDEILDLLTRHRPFNLETYRCLWRRRVTTMPQC